MLLSRLPPTSAALEQYAFRVFHQIRSWRGEIFKPTEWGRKTILMPIAITEIPAPIFILQLIY